MSEPSWREKLLNFRDILSKIDIRFAQQWELEEDKFVTRRIQATAEIKPVEDIKITSIDSLKPSSNLFYFMDGMQRTVFIGYIPSKRYVTFAPIHFHISGVILIKFNAMDGEHEAVYGPAFQEKILIPSIKLLSKDLVSKTAPFLEETIATGKPSWDYRALRKKAVDRSSQMRRAFEESSLMSFRNEKGTIVVVDGPIDGRVLERKDVVGVIKTHQRQYLSRQEEMRVFSMNKGMRSWLFEIPKEFGNKKHKILSAYIKLHDYAQDPFHGLIRVELHPSKKKITSEICAGLYNLKEPVMTRSIAWDRKIYPIYLCEKYLHANLPAIDAIRAAFGLREWM